MLIMQMKMALITYAPLIDVRAAACRKKKRELTISSSAVGHLSISTRPWASQLTSPPLLLPPPALLVTAAAPFPLPWGVPLPPPAAVPGNDLGVIDGVPFAEAAVEEEEAAPFVGVTLLAAVAGAGGARVSEIGFEAYPERGYAFSRCRFSYVLSHLLSLALPILSLTTRLCSSVSPPPPRVTDSSRRRLRREERVSFGVARRTLAKRLPC